MTVIPGTGSISPATSHWRKRWLALSPAWKGLLLGCCSALCYSLANVGLRYVAVRTDLNWAMWVAAWKVMPTAVAGWILITRSRWRGRPLTWPRDVLWTLILNGLVMQFCGNVLFQYSLSRAGLALTVPLCFASLITTSAILGRVILHDPIRPRTLAAMGMLMGAVVLLSQGTRGSSTTSEADWMSATRGAAAALASGIGFAISGIVVRRSIRRAVPISFVLGVSATIGMLPAVFAVGNQGWEPLSRVLDGGGQSALLATGILNAMGFFAVSEAMRYLPVVRVNLINASQAALGGLMGVMLFHEIPTWWLVAGTLTTISSLVVLGTEET